MKKARNRPSKKHVKADIIILGCSLPGIVAAHKLKRRFGDTMAIMVLDLVGTDRTVSKCNVVFIEEHKEMNPEDENVSERSDEEKSIQSIDNVTRYYIETYSKVFKIPLPDYIFPSEDTEQNLSKLFQHGNGKTVQCLTSYHNFEYLNGWERFELIQYQNLLDNITKDVFQVNIISFESERKNLLYYDQTNMEKHIYEHLIFSISREIMKNIVSLVCGASPDSISVLFYLHQCYRTRGTRNHIDGDNTKFREKLLGVCRKRLSSKLQQSVADITLKTKSIKEIRSYDQQVILETMIGESDYVCNLLAMALRPDELHNIEFDDHLLSKTHAEIIKAMKCGKAKKFQIEYEDNFWQAQGYSGDILSLQGPILWAMECPKRSNTGKTERFVGLIGYLKVGEDDDGDFKEQVVAQLVKLFGEEAATPSKYAETNINGIFIPRFGDYVSLNKLITSEDLEESMHIEWGTLDIYADGDMAAAIQAGHLTYLNLITTLRPQAQTFEDVSMTQLRTVLTQGPFEKLYSKINYKSGMRVTAIATAVCVGLYLLRSFLRKN